MADDNCSPLGVDFPDCYESSPEEGRSWQMTVDPSD